MREIKFRGWNTKTKKFANPWLLSVYADGEVDLAGCTNIPIIINWYTGLKDRNGVDIYEGDVIRSDFFINPAIVSYNNGYPCVIYNSGIFDLMFCDFQESAVIGNIHENPELIGLQNEVK